MSNLDSAIEKANLSYVSLQVIECFKDAGLDQVYIADKIDEFANLKKFDSLHKALKMLDEKNMVRLAGKLGVSVGDLNATLLVLNRL
ncbi:TPA: hypothetical protein MW242_002932 [Acinetobacter baumannii]|nr:hypothetical protein [Acinetobacter baumannii]